MREKEDTEKAWHKVKGKYKLDNRELELAKLLHWTPEDLEAKAPSKKEPWKDEPALHIRRCYDKFRLHLKPQKPGSEWMPAKKQFHLDNEEIREAVELEMSPEDVMKITGWTALTIRRLYDKQRKRVSL